MMPRSLTAIAITGWFVLMTPLRGSAEETASPEQLQFFEAHIRPLLANRCFKCHGADKQKGGLRLDALNTILTGGESGPAIVPGNPEESLLVEAIRYESFEMPPDGQLPEAEIALLIRWVKMGAPWPAEDGNVSLPTAGTITDEDRGHWAFQPLVMPAIPSVVRGPWSVDASGEQAATANATDNGQRATDHPIDAFIFRKLAEHELQLSPPADRLTLVRRLYQDLIGLPPTPEQIDAFLSDGSPDAYPRLVDSLLDSPRYGEHWATFWLDLVRYADSDGYKADDDRPNAWQYRDYVIRAFNDDKPYDRFVMEQIAGDELVPDDPQALAATGYLRHGVYEYNQRDAFTQWQEILNDITDTTGDVFLGMGMGCARCHDHKFDPILQKDYYRLQAFFSGIAFRDDVPIATPEQVSDFNKKLADWSQQTADIRRQIDALEQPKLKQLAREMIETFPPETEAIMDKAPEVRTAHERQIAHLVHLQVIDKQQKELATKFKAEEKERWESLKKQLAAFDDQKPAPLPDGRTISDIAETAAVVFIPGKERLGQIAPGFLSVLDESDADYAPLPTSPHTTGRRAALARWLTRPDHPLTTRVIVNRIWQQHFGTGIVATPSDFGRLGEPPSHPELLDWLAASFVESGWSLKWLHRQIVTSQTFQQSSVVVDESVVRGGSSVVAGGDGSSSQRTTDNTHQTRLSRAMTVDPGNRLLWRQNIRRMNAEQIRDAVLMVSGRLEQASGGPPEDAAKSKRRTVYTKVLRNSRDPLLDVFDLPDRITGTGSRNVTTTPAQSLYMINNDRLLSAAAAYAERLDAELPAGGESQVRLAYRLAYSRDPSEEELRLPMKLIEENPPRSVPSSQETVIAAMPGTGGRAVVIDPDDEFSLLHSSSDQPTPTSDFTVEAVVLLKSLYADATVRTILSQWDGNTRHPGWALGITSTRSAHQPRNLILQLVGTNADGADTYEVVASGIHLELNQPYYVSANVDLDDTSDAGVAFYVRRLGVAEEAPQSAHAAHQVTGGNTNDRRAVVGGRDASTRHRWDGLVDEVRLSNRVLSESELFVNSSDSPEGVLGWWTFESDGAALADVSGSGLALHNGAEPQQAAPGLVDFCHVLLNSNEFLYVD